MKTVTIFFNSLDVSPVTLPASKNAYELDFGSLQARYKKQGYNVEISGIQFELDGKIVGTVFF